MTDPNALEVQEKRELVTKAEKTVPGRSYMPVTDIVETADALVVSMEMPGVDRANPKIKVEDDVLTVEGDIDASKYDGLQPLYTEYNIGPFARSFALSQVIDQQQIGATFADGVLTLTLKKVEKAKPRQIEVR